MASLDGYVLLVVLSLGYMCSVCQGGIGVENVGTACLNAYSMMQLECPPHHDLAVQEAGFYRSKESGCHSDSFEENKNQYCMEANVHGDLFRQCYPGRNCTVHLSDRLASAPNRSDCSATHAGSLMLHVSYSCYSPNNHLDMCSANGTWYGSLLYVYSPSFPDLSTTHNCGCSIRMQVDLDIIVRIPMFEPDDKADSVLSRHKCSQSIVFWTEYGREKICSDHQDSLENLAFERGRHIHMQYHNPFLLQSNYLIMLQVHHDYTFHITCGSNMTMNAPTTTDNPLGPLHSAPPTTPGTFMSAPSTHNADMSTSSSGGIQKPREHESSTSQFLDGPALWPLVGGAIAALVVMVTIIVVSVLYCRRKKRRKQDRQCVAELNQNVFENTVYMSAREVPRQGQGHVQGQGQDEVRREPAVRFGASGVSMSPLPEKPGFDYFAHASEPVGEIPEADSSDEEEVKVKAAAESTREREVKRSVSVRDRARQMEARLSQM